MLPCPQDSPGKNTGMGCHARQPIPDPGIEPGCPELQVDFYRLSQLGRPFRYDLNQIPYTVEVMNRFKWLDLVECLKNCGWRFVTLHMSQWPKPPPKKKCKKVKRLSEEALQAAEERREIKGKGEREKHTQLNAEFQRIVRRDKEAFLKEQCK